MFISRCRKTPLALAIGLTLVSVHGYTQQLEEVVVTAQKRVESLQDVPISVSAVQGEQIQEAGIPNMAALADYVPNLHIANASVNTNIYMRGVGSGNNQGFEQSVGMYIDGIYMGRGRQYRNAFVDLQRVEVLRGPQGTLFGRNTIAGAVNITTASTQPGEKLNGEISLAGESNGGLITEGFIGGSVTDTLAARFAFKYRETDGYVDNKYLGEDEPNLEDTAYRVSLVWEPLDELTATFKYSHSDEERTGAQSATWKYLDSTDRDALFPNRSAFASAGYALMDVNFPNFGAEAGEDFETIRDNGYGSGSTIGIGKYEDGDDADVDNYMLNVDYELGEYTLTSVTGYSEYDMQANADVDWLPLRFIARDDDQDFDQFSQEIRITSPVGEFFDFVAGAYYDESSLSIDRRVSIDGTFDDLFGDLPASALGVPVPLPLRDLGISSLYTALTLLGGNGGRNQMQQGARNHIYDLDSKSWAVFFQGTFNITDNFRVTTGLRYTYEEKDVKSRQFLSDDRTGMGTPSNDWDLAQIQATSFNTYAYDYNDDRDTDELIPSIILQWDVGEDSMLYASFSQGFKSGGFTAADDGEPGDLDPGTFPCAEGPGVTVDISSCYDPTVPNEDFEFDDENVDAYEVGGKHTLFDNSVTVNWAAFYTQYDNLQTAVFKGVGFNVKNAGSSEIKGVEIDGRWAATDNLQFGMNFAYLDATYDEFRDAPCTAIQLDANPACGVADPALNPSGDNNDLSGEPTLYASDYSASLLWDYTLPISGMDFFVSGEANYRDGFHSAGDNDPIDEIEDYTKVNLRIGLRADSWEIMAYGRNIFDEAALQQSFDTPVLAGSHSYFMDEGAVVGLRAKYIFQ